MKNIFLVIISFFAFTACMDAQEKLTEKGGEVTQKEIKRYLDARMEMDYRNNTIEALGLTEEEINEFDPMFKRYMDDKDGLVQEKIDLLEYIREEMKEDDSKSNQDEDLADFIEEYWEVEIDEMKLRQQFFDDLENKIPVEKAIQYFIWENAVEGTLERKTYVDYFPQILVLKVDTASVAKTDRMKKKEMNRKSGMNARRAVRNYSNWVSDTRRGVSMSHEFSSTALKKLVRAITAIKEDKGYTIPSFEEKKKMVMNNAHQLRKDMYSDNHADLISDAFMAVTDMINDVAYKGSTKPNNQLVFLSKQIDKEKLLLEQSEAVYNFFYEADQFITTLMKK